MNHDDLGNHSHSYVKELQQQVAAAQAREAKLREAIEYYAAGGFNGTKLQAIRTLPADDTALKERLAQEREKCAMLAQVAGAIHVADTIRSMT